MSVARQCELLGLPRSTFYYEPSGQDDLNLLLMRLIDEQYTQTPFYGSPKMTQWLRREGWTVNHKRVERLMREMGLQAALPRRSLSLGRKEHRKWPYLLGGMKIERPNQVWCSDITYVRMARGFAYLVAVMDWFSRYVLSWEISGSLDSAFCVQALKRALGRGRHKAVLRRSRHIDDPRELARGEGILPLLFSVAGILPAIRGQAALGTQGRPRTQGPLRVRLATRPTRHHVRIDVHRIDRVGHRDDVVQAEDLLHVAGIGLGAVADEDLVQVETHAPGGKIVLDNRPAQEFIADATVIVAPEGLLPAHLVHGPVHGLDHRGRQRLRDIADAHADNLGLRLRLFERPDPPADLREQVSRPELQKVLVDSDHGFAS